VLNRIAFLSLIALIAINISFAEVEVSNSFDDSLQVDESFTSRLSTTAVSNPEFDISELLPSGWEITDWSVSGNQSAVIFSKEGTVSYGGTVREVYKWKFSSPAPNGIEIQYTAIPRRGGNFNITTVITFNSPAGFSSYDNEVYVGGGTAEIMCGNGICESIYGENSETCAEDCRFDKTMVPQVWLAVLILALAIIYVGLAYKEWKKYGYLWFAPKRNILDQPPESEVASEKIPRLPRPSRAAVKRKLPEEPEFPSEKQVEEEPKPFFTEIVKKAVELVPKQAKRMGKKSGKKAKKAKSKGLHTVFYEETMKRLEKIKKTLK
jgi:hypothetical protein